MQLTELATRINTSLAVIAEDDELYVFKVYHNNGVDYNLQAAYTSIETVGGGETIEQLNFELYPLSDPGDSQVDSIPVSNEFGKIVLEKLEEKARGDDGEDDE